MNPIIEPPAAPYTPAITGDANVSTPSPLDSLLARLKATGGKGQRGSGIKAQRRGIPGAFGKTTLHDTMEKARQADPVRAAARAARRDERRKQRAARKGA